MAADDSGSSLKQTSDGGLSGTHESADLLDVPVATATTSEKNTIVLPLRPVACWSMGDVRFAFDSSFIAPSASEEFALLADVREDNKAVIQNQNVYPPVTIFGHADPVGQDDYNKQLAGRRARAVYGALIRDTSEWEHLYSQKVSSDDWGMRSIQTMLSELGYYNADPSGSIDDATQTAVHDFQQAEGLSADGDPGPQTRAKLFELYMDLLCGDLKLSKTDDFLARGADSAGKGDVQGCGEFNPVLMFSAAENDDLNQPDRHGERDAQNAPNRRVLTLLFSPGEQVDPNKWPCPRTSEGTTGCRKRFWSDAARRRSFQEQRRLYEVTHDTFACRFYDLLNTKSPCERALAVLRVRLHDLLGNKMPNVQYELEYGSRTKNGRADAEGFVSEVLDPDTETCTVRWEPPPANSGSDQDFLHELSVYITLPDLETDDGIKRRLHNLGYPITGEPELNLRSFQAHHGVNITGQADDDTKKKLRSIYGDALDEPVVAQNSAPATAPDSEQRT